MQIETELLTIKQIIWIFEKIKIKIKIHASKNNRRSTSLVYEKVFGI